MHKATHTEALTGVWAKWRYYVLFFILIYSFWEGTGKGKE